MSPLPTSPEFWLIWLAVLLGTAYAMRKVVQPEPADIGDYLPQEDKMDTMPEQLTFDDALAKREAVLAEVAADNYAWMTRALDAFKALPCGEVGTGEDVRMDLLERGLSPAPHANCWGALLRTLVKRGDLVPTGEYRPMRAKSSNGRRTPVYVRMEPREAA